MPLITTTQNLEGYTIVSYLGIVTGEAVLGANIFRDLFAGIRDVIGGRAGAYEDVLSQGRDTALLELRSAAQSRGANAIVGVSLDYESLGDRGSMLMVIATGTAVVVEAVHGTSQKVLENPWA